MIKFYLSCIRGNLSLVGGFSIKNDEFGKCCNYWRSLLKYVTIEDTENLLLEIETRISRLGTRLQKLLIRNSKKGIYFTINSPL